jgi:hypothetical protein
MPTRCRPEPQPTRCLNASLLLAAIAAADPATAAYGTGASDAGCAAEAASDGNWTLTFEDAFDGVAINTSNWRVANNIGHNLGNGELQAYFADEVSVSGGNLVLRTRLNPGALNSSGKVLPFNWTSGWVDSVGNVQFTYGKVEASIRLPKENNGVWPAFWIEDDADWPNAASAPSVGARTHCWPTGGEIDILEAFGGQDDESIKATYREYTRQIGTPRLSTFPNPSVHPLGPRALPTSRATTQIGVRSVIPMTGGRTVQSRAAPRARTFAAPLATFLMRSTISRFIGTRAPSLGRSTAGRTSRGSPASPPHCSSRSGRCGLFSTPRSTVTTGSRRTTATPCTCSWTASACGRGAGRRAGRGSSRFP